MDDGEIVWFWIGAHHEYDDFSDEYDPDDCVTLPVVRNSSILSSASFAPVDAPDGTSALPPGAIAQADVDLDGRVPTRVEHLTRAYVGYGGHGIGSTLEEFRWGLSC